jgi:hypothetical protein
MFSWWCSECKTEFRNEDHSVVVKFSEEHKAAKHGRVIAGTFENVGTRPEPRLDDEVIAINADGDQVEVHEYATETFMGQPVLNPRFNPYRGRPNFEDSILGDNSYDPLHDTGLGDY